MRTKTCLFGMSYLMFLVMGFATSGLSQTPDTLSLFVSPAVACDSPHVNVMIGIGDVPLTLRKFSVGMKYYNGSFYFNGNLTPNPVFDSLHIDYMPGDATDWLTIERTDTTPVTISEPWLFSFQANYFGGNYEINIDTFSFSPNQSFVEDSSGQNYFLSCFDGWVYSPQASCQISPAPLEMIDVVFVPVVIQDMPPLEYFGFSILYPEDRLTLLDITDLNPALVPFTNFSYSTSGGKINVAWHSGMPLATIGSGELFRMKFGTVQPVLPGVIDLSFDSLSFPYFLGPDTATQVYIPTCFADGFVSIMFDVPEMDPSANSLRIYPNPSSGGHYRLSIPAGEKVFQWSLFQCNGSLVRSENVVDATQINEFNINASDLPGGIYLVSVFTEKNEYRGKLVR